MIKKRVDLISFHWRALFYVFQRPMSGGGDLLIVGPGRLGLLVAALWRQQQHAARVLLKFRSEDPQRTRDLEQQGYVVLPPETTVRVI